MSSPTKQVERIDLIREGQWVYFYAGGDSATFPASLAEKGRIVLAAGALLGEELNFEQNLAVQCVLGSAEYTSATLMRGGIAANE